jgi:hypothetical protein
MQAEARLTKACGAPAKYALDGAPLPRLCLRHAARVSSSRDYLAVLMRPM